MKERIFNIFLNIIDNVIISIGVVCHNRSGTDEEKLIFLKNNVLTDRKKTTQFSLPKSFKLKKDGKVYNALHYDRYREMSFNGTEAGILESIFNHYNASLTPLMCITPIMDGKIKIDGVDQIEPIQKKHPKKIFEELAPSYLDIYFNDKEFRFTDLINDDFYSAIKITFQNKHYVSSIKLFVSCIDSLAYLEFGDIKGNFQKWLDSYADLSSLNITSEELWEFRNSILHMTNLDSRKILNKQISRLQFYVSNKDIEHLKQSDEGKYFNYKRLLNVVSHAIVKWGNSYNKNPEKMRDFLDRYDRILSDQRFSKISIK